MKTPSESALKSVLSSYETDLLPAWIEAQKGAATRGRTPLPDAEVREQSRQFLAALGPAVQKDHLADLSGEGWAAVRDILKDLSRSRATQGATPSETAAFVFSLRDPLLRFVQAQSSSEDGRAESVREASRLVDILGLFTMELFQKSREELIARQQQEMLELSTPVVKLYDQILALPLIGTLDSARTQVVMENLLQRIVETGAEIAIIDITGVPTVDTLVAQHLLKAVAAARLMGADCIISGIRPQIAQTIVHLGVELSDVDTKATMAGAFALALGRLGLAVRPISKAAPGKGAEK